MLNTRNGKNMNEEDLNKLCEEAIGEFPERWESLVNNFKHGKAGLIGMFAGEVMKKSKGHSDPKKIVELLKKLLNK